MFFEFLRGKVCGCGGEEKTFEGGRVLELAEKGVKVRSMYGNHMKSYK